MFFYLLKIHLGINGEVPKGYKEIDLTQVSLYKLTSRGCHAKIVATHTRPPSLIQTYIWTIPPSLL